MNAEENVFFDFIGFSPGCELVIFIKETINRLQWNAPSDSAIKLTLKKVGQVFSYKCKICSVAGVFNASAVNSCPIEGMRELERILYEKILEWKRHRFENEAESNAEEADSLKVIPIQDQYDLICG